MRSHGACEPERVQRRRYEVADIFRAHGEAYRAAHPLTPEQRKVMWCIEACRTSVLGGHLDLCLDCGHQEPAYNSCRNRHCPKCQALEQARWLERQQKRILPVPYFHIVFTLPSELRPLVLRNRELVYGLLFKAATQSLLALGRDSKRLGALLGITAVLHTWTRDLRFHPHLHCIVTGGGLATDGQRWSDSGPKFLVHVEPLRRLFRGKFLDAIKRMHQRGLLDLGDSQDPPEILAKLLSKLYAIKWGIHAERPFAGPRQVFSYLGLYTHRVAISNHRLLAVTDDSVTIATKNGNTATMHPQQFIRRFLLHVLPKGFVKIRHYGLLASCNAKTKLAKARELLQLRGEDVQRRDPDNGEAADWRTLLEQLTGIDLKVCRHCGSRRLQRGPLPEQANPLRHRARARAPPAEAA